MNLSKLEDIFKELEFSGLLKKIGSNDTIEPKTVERKKDYKNILNLEDLIGFVESLEEEKWLSVDLETTSINPMAADIVGFSFSTKKNQTKIEEIGGTPKKTFRETTEN